MSIKKITHKACQLEKAHDRMLKYCDELNEMLKKVFKGTATFGVTPVGGEGIQLVYEAEGMNAYNVDLAGIIREIDEKGYFDDRDLYEYSYG